MNLYFESDIFLGVQAGIFRYSREMAIRFAADPSLSCKFVFNRRHRAMRALEEVRPVLGDNAIFYERFAYQDGTPYPEFSRKHRNRFYELRKSEPTTPTLAHKLRREMVRIAYRNEEKKMARANLRFYFEGRNPVLFGPHGPLSAYGSASPAPFRVQVLYDVIPKLFPELCNSNDLYDQIFHSLDENQLIITISEHTRSDLLRLNPKLDPAKVHAIPIASSDHFAPVTDQREIDRAKTKYGIPLDSDYVFSLSTLEPRKNYVRLLKAWSSIYNQLNLKQPKLVIGGRKGWGDAFQAELFGRAEQEQSVILTGFVDDADLAALYSGSVCTAFPSLYEGFGIPVLESMKCGRFCVTSNVSSIPEITGADTPMVEPTSIDSIADLLLRVINDPTWRKSLEIEVLRRAAEFSWEKTYTRTRDLIAQMSGG